MSYYAHSLLKSFSVSFCRKRQWIQFAIYRTKQTWYIQVSFHCPFEIKVYFLLLLPTFTHLFTALSQQKTHFCLPRQRCVFWMMFAFGKWWRLRLMMFASRMMCACGHIGANIASLRHAVEQHHFERSEKHHIAVGDASFDKWKFVEQIATEGCLSKMTGYGKI